MQVSLSHPHERHGISLEIDPPLRFWHDRDKDQIEVDLIIEFGSDLWGVEVRAAASISPGDSHGLQRLAHIAGRHFRGGLVLYNGGALLPMDRKRNILALPLAHLWGD